MKKTIVIVCIIAAFLLGITATAVITGAFGEINKKKKYITNYGGQILYDASSFSDEQIAQLEEAGEEDRFIFGF